MRESDSGVSHGAVRAGTGSTLSRDIVAFTRRNSRSYNRARTSFGEVFADIYTSVLAFGCLAAIAVSFVLALRDEVAGQDPTQGGLLPGNSFQLPSSVLWALLTYAALTGILTVSRRLGPIAVTGAQGTWWLPLPLDRTPMVRPTFLRRVIWVGVGSVLGYFAFSLVTALNLSATGHALAAGTFGAASVGVLGIAAMLQLSVRNPRSLRALSALVLVPLALLPGFAPDPWAFALALLAAVGMVVVVFRRAGQVRGSELIRGGAVSGHAGASVFFLDTNELMRSLAGEPRPMAANRAAALYAMPARSPHLGLVKADVAAFLRLQPPLTVPALWLVACLALMLADVGLSVPVQLAFVVVAGCVVASGMGTVARRTALLPELDAMLPLSPAQVRASRMLMPAVALGLWMTVLSGAVVLLGRGGLPLILVGALAGVGMGAGTVRGASRPAADWTVPPVDTPFGPVPRTQLSALLRGLDVTIAAMLPLLLALYIGQATTVILLMQAVVTGVVILVVLYSRPTAAGQR